MGETLALAIEAAGDDRQSKPKQASRCNGPGDLGMDNLYLPTRENEQRENEFCQTSQADRQKAPNGRAGMRRELVCCDADPFREHGYRKNTGAENPDR